MLENGAGQFFTFVCNEHGVAYSEDRIKYQCGLGNVCFYNSNISIPIDGNIRIYSYQKQAFKDFECEAVFIDLEELYDERRKWYDRSTEKSS